MHVRLPSLLLAVVWPVLAPAASTAPMTNRFGETLRTDSFKYHVWTNWVARTNGRSPQIMRSITEIPGTRGTQATNALWNTNWYFFGTENFTAMTHVKTNLGGDVWWTKKAAIISPVALLQAGHAYCANNAQQTTCGSNAMYLAVDATNGQHWRRAVVGVSRQESAGAWGRDTWFRLDYVIIGLGKPFPTNIAAMPIAQLEDIERCAGRELNWPSHAACQHSLTLDNASFKGTGHAVAGGDSGSPTFFVVSNRLVIGINGMTAPHYFGTGTNAHGLKPLEQLLTDYTNVLLRAGHDPSKYPLQFETLSAFPAH
jgi:hypothetical protein